jgi:hypothetical protein
VGRPLGIVGGRMSPPMIHFFQYTTLVRCRTEMFGSVLMKLTDLRGAFIRMHLAQAVQSGLSEWPSPDGEHISSPSARGM